MLLAEDRCDPQEILLIEYLESHSQHAISKLQVCYALKLFNSITAFHKNKNRNIQS